MERKNLNGYRRCTSDWKAKKMQSLVLVCFKIERFIEGKIKGSMKRRVSIEWVYWNVFFKTSQSSCDKIYFWLLTTHAVEMIISRSQSYLTTENDTSDCHSGHEFTPWPGHITCGVWSWNNFYSHFHSTADSSRVVVSYWQKNTGKLLRRFKLAQETWIGKLTGWTWP